MRDIKFRCWHNGYGKKIPAKMIYDDKPGDCLVWKWQGQNIESIMQFTGLKDKNGKEIWEGDIVSNVMIGGDIYGKGEVVFDDGAFSIVLKARYLPPLYEADPMHIEVTGNIHENPELLEATDGK